MDSKNQIEIALRAGMIAHDILDLLGAKDKRVIELMLLRAQKDLNELKKIVATVA